MNEQLQNALVSILGKAIDGIDASVAFMQAELPDVINQLLLWYSVKSAVFSVLGVIVFFIPFYVYKKCDKAKKEKAEKGKYTDREFDVWMPSAVSCILCWPLSAMLISLEWLQIWIAPKIWLIEYAASLTK